MFPRNPLAFWHKSAQRPALREFGFAKIKGVCHAVGMAKSPDAKAKIHDCYPSPFMQPDPAGVRLSFSRPGMRPARSLADRQKSRRIGFSIQPALVNLAAIKTLLGGRALCVFSRSLPPLSLPPALLAACKPMASARLSALALALLRRKPLVAAPVTRCLLAWPVVRLARFATTQAFATDLTAAPRSQRPLLKAIQARRLGGLFAFASRTVCQPTGQP